MNVDSWWENQTQFAIITRSKEKKGKNPFYVHWFLKEMLTDLVLFFYKERKYKKLDSHPVTTILEKQI